MRSGSGEGFKQFSIRLADKYAIFRVPLDSDSESRIRLFERLDDSITGDRRYDQPLAQALDSLVVPGIHVVPAATDDLRQTGIRRNPNPVRRGMLARLRIR
jgi:hypothetical protein